MPRQRLEILGQGFLALAAVRGLPVLSEDSRYQVLVTRCFAAVSQAIATLLRESGMLNYRIAVVSENSIACFSCQIRAEACSMFW